MAIFCGNIIYLIVPNEEYFPFENVADQLQLKNDTIKQETFEVSKAFTKKQR